MTNQQLITFRAQVPAAALILIALLAAGAAAGETVTVLLKSGRSFAGEIESGTGPDRLWLATQSAGMVLVRRIDWDRVVSAQQGERTLTADELRQEALGIAATSSHEVRPLPPPSALPQQLFSTPDIGPVAGLLPVPAGPPLPLVVPPGPWLGTRVRSMDIDAYVANWDEDVEIDGLVVELYPRSCYGDLVPVDGTLAVELTGQWPSRVHDREPFVETGDWRRTVHVTDFGPLGGVYTLEFEREHPEFNLDLGALGLVHARLTVPGQGTFDASQDMVRIRPYSAVRDNIQQRTGQRFLPHERTGPGH